MNIKPDQETWGAEQKAKAELGHVLAGMQDSLTDEMVTRLAETLSVGAGLLDQLGRSGLNRIIPLLAELVESGDLARIVELARLVSAVQDAATDEMVSRLNELVSNTITLLDRFDRSGVADDLLNSLEGAAALTKDSSAARGGLKGLWSIAREPETQESLRYLLLISRQFRAGQAKRLPASHHS